LYVGRGDAKRARATLEKSLGTRPDLRTVQIMAELALDDDDLVAVSKYEQQLEQIEGADGTSWQYVRAQRLTKAAIPMEAQKRGTILSEASRLQERIVLLRPDWPGGYLLKAQLAKLQEEKPSVAIDAYIQAIRCGESRVKVIEDLVFLLYRENRLTEAESYLDRVRQPNLMPATLAPLAMALDMKHGNSQRAIALAQSEITKEPEKWDNQLRLGQLLFLD